MTDQCVGHAEARRCYLRTATNHPMVDGRTSLMTNTISPTIGTEGIVDVDDNSIDRRPWGIYVPPAIDNAEAVDIVNNDGMTKTPATGGGGGYVRIVNAQGKSFPCGFSRPVGTVLPTMVGGDVVVAGKKRCRQEISNNSNMHNECGEFEDEGVDTNSTQQKTTNQKVTITEERIHPEEALFLHMRGRLRIETSTTTSSHNLTASNANQQPTRLTLSTQYLFCIMLPECNIPLAAYLAYAHLRAQGYILVRYSDQRMKLLCKMQHQQQQNLSTQSVTEMSQNAVSTSERVSNTICDVNQKIQQSANGDGCIPVKSSGERSRTRPLRSLLSDDVANAPPPCVVSSPDESEACIESPTNNTYRLAYYAYNPNSHFKRSNPGLPNFGVAVMPFRNGPTFDDLMSIVGGGRSDHSDRINSDIPLRMVTVSDGGAIIAFGVTNGDVPNIRNQHLSVECGTTGE